MVKTKKNLTAELISQHQAIEIATARLQNLMSSGPEDRLTFLREIRQQAKTLAEMLADHFKFENSCGKFDDLIGSFPHLASDVKRILGEHDQLGANLKAIAEKAAALEENDPEQAHTLKRDFEQFHSKFRRHETRELDVIQKAHLTDISCAD